MCRIIYICSQLNIISDMKKIMMALAAVFCCAMTTAVFTACGGDDDSKTPTPDPTMVVGYQVDYSLEFPQEIPFEWGPCGNMYLLCDKIEVGYIDENGQEQREVVNNGKWTKSVTYKKTLNGYLKLYLTKPASIDVESLPYDYYENKMDLLPNYSLKGVMAIYSNGTKVEAENGIVVKPNNLRSITIGKENISRYIEEKLMSEIEIMTIKLNI